VVAATAVPAYARKPADARVVVVGAGLAGLTTAYRLKQAGYACQIYEATTRAGGRCWTRYGGFAEGQITERGGEFIDTGHGRIRTLAGELGLPLLDVKAAETPGTSTLFYFDGQPYTEAQAQEDYREVRPQLSKDVKTAPFPTTYRRSTRRGRELDHTSVAEYIDQIVPGGRGSPFGQLLDVAYNIEYGAETDGQSALNLLYLLGYSPPEFAIFGESDERLKVDGGNDQLVRALVAEVGSQIRFASVLVEIARRANGGYDLVFDRAGTTTHVRADRVVLALPFSVLRASVDYSRASFSSLKDLAIRTLGMGANAKLAVQFTDRHWRALGCNGETFSDQGYQASWEATRAQSGSAGILVDYTGGDYAAGLSGSADSLARRFAAQLEPVLPGIAARYNGRAKLDHWPSNPWTHGAYAYYKVGQYTSFGGIEGAREGECHFCGEHTSLGAQGFMEGAVETGERAAREVIAALR
jgi:monoamine oxidase